MTRNKIWKTTLYDLTMDLFEIDLLIIVLDSLDVCSYICQGPIPMTVSSTRASRGDILEAFHDCTFETSCKIDQTRAQVIAS